MSIPLVNRRAGRTTIATRIMVVRSGFSAFGEALLKPVS